MVALLDYGLGYLTLLLLNGRSCKSTYLYANMTAIESIFGC